MRGDELSQGFRKHQRLLWGICYRMTGSATDADDLVQDTFARALEKSPRGDLRPWLVTVAMNKCRDLLRLRKRRKYVGPWLPEPVELGEDGLAPGSRHDNLSPSARYELRESASMAFLLALEALSPRQRAVLLLRDVFDLSVRETATTLELTEANVKTTLHRARKRMADYSERTPRTANTQLAMEALQRFVGCVAAQDVDAVKQLLVADCVALSDGGGEYFAARVPVVGPAKIAKFYANIAKQRAPATQFEMRTLNGMPALLVRTDGELAPGHAPRVVMLVDVADDGRITAIYSLLKTDKVRALFD